MGQKHCVIALLLLLPPQEAGREGELRQTPRERAAENHWESSATISGLGRCGPLTVADLERFETHFDAEGSDQDGLAAPGIGPQSLCTICLCKDGASPDLSCSE